MITMKRHLALFSFLLALSFSLSAENEYKTRNISLTYGVYGYQKVTADHPATKNYLTDGVVVGNDARKYVVGYQPVSMYSLSYDTRLSDGFFTQIGAYYGSGSLLPIQGPKYGPSGELYSWGLDGGYSTRSTMYGINIGMGTSMNLTKDKRAKLDIVFLAAEFANSKGYVYGDMPIFGFYAQAGLRYYFSNKVALVATSKFSYDVLLPNEWCDLKEVGVFALGCSCQVGLSFQL